MSSPQKVPTPSPSDHASQALDAARHGDWTSFFNSPAAIDLRGESLFQGNQEAKVHLLAQDPPLLDQAINAAIDSRNWDFILSVFHSGLATACPPGKLNSSHPFKSGIYSDNRDLSPQDSAKVSLWRSILVANPWHGSTLSDTDYREWSALSAAVMRSLSISTVAANEFSNPASLIHVVDAVNESLRAYSTPRPTPKDQTRPSVTLAAASLIEALSRSTAPLAFTQGALSELKLSPLSEHASLKEAFLSGVTRALVPSTAVAFLHQLATDEVACPDLTLRVSALSRLLLITQTPVPTLLAVLRDSKHGEVRTIAMKALTQALAFPLMGKARQGVRECGPKGGAIIRDLLSGLDKSNSMMEEVTLFPNLVRKWIAACSATGVQHGISTDTITSYHIGKGGPLSGSQVDFSLEPLDPISVAGLACIARRCARL